MWSLACCLSQHCIRFVRPPFVEFCNGSQLCWCKVAEGGTGRFAVRQFAGDICERSDILVGGKSSLSVVSLVAESSLIALLSTPPRAENTAVGT